MNRNNKKINPYLISSVMTLGGLCIGAVGTWMYTKLSKNKHYIKSTITNQSQDNTTLNYDEGVYIQEDNETKFLTNSEFQRYFEYNIINKKNGIDLDWGILEYALKLDPMNLRFLNEKQKTNAFEQLAVKNNIEALIHCKYIEEKYELSESLIEPVYYNKYDIHDYAFELYGIEIYKYIDHPEGYSYDELLSMPPPEFKDMTFSEVFYKIQKEDEAKNSEANIQNPELIHGGYTDNQIDSADEFSSEDENENENENENKD